MRHEQYYHIVKHFQLMQLYGFPDGEFSRMEEIVFKEFENDFKPKSCFSSLQ
jgi:hypothetical protein